MWHYLNGLTQVVAVAFTVYYRLIYTACGDAVVTSGADTRKALVVTQIQVGLETILRYIALPMLVGVQRTGVDVDVRVKLLDSDLVAACLQQLAYAGRNNSLAK